MKKLVLHLFAFLPLIALAQNINDDLILYYPFDGNTIDASANGLDATPNGVTLTTDRNGNANSAYLFDGSSDIHFPESSLIKRDLPISVSFWVKPASLDQINNPFFDTDHSYNVYAGIHSTTSADNTGKVTVGFGGNTVSGPAGRRSKVSDVPLTLGVWQHVVLVIRGSEDMDIYIDCEDAGGTYNGSGSTTIAYGNLEPSTIGSIGPNSGSATKYRTGEMDDFAMWGRALTPSDVQDLCNGVPLKVSETDLAKNFQVYPNPTTGFVQFESNNTELSTYQVFDITGKLVKQGKVSGNAGSFELSDLDKGLYTVVFENESEGLVSIEKVIYQ